jgi:rRNA-processing protein FCF1
MGNNMKTIIIDTNFFLLLTKIDIFTEIRYLIEGEYELIITQKILNELEHLSKRNKQANFGLMILKEKLKDKSIKLHENLQHPDDFIPIFSKNKELIVCTNDADLRKKAKKAGAKVISLKANKKIDYS